jgi:hypothetical protein
MTADQADLLRLLQRNPGGTLLADILLATGRVRHLVCVDLFALKALGLVASAKFTDLGTLWATAADLAAIKAKRAAERAARFAAAKASATNADPDGGDELAASERFDRKSIRRTLPQDEWLRQLPHRGVSSVFHLGLGGDA